MSGWMGEWVDGWMDRCIEHLNEWVGPKKGGCMDRWMGL